MKPSSSAPESFVTSLPAQRATTEAAASVEPRGVPEACNVTAATTSSATIAVRGPDDSEPHPQAIPSLMMTSVRLPTTSPVKELRLPLSYRSALEFDGHGRATFIAFWLITTKFQILDLAPSGVHRFSLAIRILLNLVQHPPRAAPGPCGRPCCPAVSMNAPRNKHTSSCFSHLLCHQYRGGEE